MSHVLPSLDPAYRQLLPQLKNAALSIGVTLTARQETQLLYYLQQLLFWNKAYNLTAIKDQQSALVKHIFDSLSIIPYLPDGNLLDIGTGAGLPAVIIAICQPSRTVTALDSNQKKIRARCSSHSAGGSTARSNSVTWFGNASSRMAATMSGASVVRLTIRLT